MAAALAWWLTLAIAAWLDPLIADLAHQYAFHWSVDVLPAGFGPAFCALAALGCGVLTSLAVRLAQRAAMGPAAGLNR